MTDEMKYFKTDNLALCPYLVMNDLRYKGVEQDPDNNNKFVFVFEDPKSQASDLSIAFLKSRERSYKNHWSFFRNELAKMQSKK